MTGSLASLSARASLAPRRPDALCGARDVERRWPCASTRRSSSCWRRGRCGGHPLLAGLGPDLLDEEPDITAAVAPPASTGPAKTSIAEALLDQRVVAGIGNVYRSEVSARQRHRPRSHRLPGPAVPSGCSGRAHLLRANVRGRAADARPGVLEGRTVRPMPTGRSDGSTVAPVDPAAAAGRSSSRRHSGPRLAALVVPRVPGSGRSRAGR